KSLDDNVAARHMQDLDLMGVRVRRHMASERVSTFNLRPIDEYGNAPRRIAGGRHHEAVEGQREVGACAAGHLVERRIDSSRVSIWRRSSEARRGPAAGRGRRSARGGIVRW